jgi:hypothetical protein
MTEKLPPIVGHGALKAGTIIIKASRARRRKSLASIIKQATKFGATVVIDGAAIVPGKYESNTAANPWDEVFLHERH